MGPIGRERWVFSLVAAILIVIAAMVGSSWGVRKVHSRFSHEMAQRLDLEAQLAERDQERERFLKQIEESRVKIEQLTVQIQQQKALLQQERKNRMALEQLLKQTREQLKSIGLE